VGQGVCEGVCVFVGMCVCLLDRLRHVYVCGCVWCVGIYRRVHE